MSALTSAQLDFAHELATAFDVPAPAFVSQHREAFERFFARVDADADRRHRDRWHDQLAPRERLLTELLESVSQRIGALDQLRARAANFALRGGPPPGTVLVDGSRVEFVYALVDPDARESIRYVGRAKDPIARYWAHCSDVRCDNKGVFSWCRGLGYAGKLPLMLLLEACAPENVENKEAHWILHYRALDQADLNVYVPGRSNALHTAKSANNG